MPANKVWDRAANMWVPAVPEAEIVQLKRWWWLPVFRLRRYKCNRHNFLFKTLEQWQIHWLKTHKHAKGKA